MIALVDNDVLIYRCGWAAKDGDFIQNVECLDNFLQSIYDKVQAVDKKLILSGHTNFRKEIDPNYKSNRKESARPKYYKELREYCVNQLGASVTDGIEADDAIGTLQGEGTCICSSDKDYLQISGYHLRFKKRWEDNEIIYVDEDEAWFNFFKQVAMGDAVDCIAGLKGIGEAKATKALQDKTKGEMLETVQEMYQKQFGNEWYEPFDRTCRLIFIQRNNAKEYFELL